MKINKLLVVITIFICAGCWSARSKAEETVNMKIVETVEKNRFLKNLPKDFEQPTDDAGRLLLKEYGAVFLARNGAAPPKTVVFRDETDVSAFQSTLKWSSETIGAYRVELQTAAMTALKAAMAEANSAKLSISPRGADSSRRGYTQTVSLWASRVNPGFFYWVGKGRVTQAEANRIKALTPYQQVPEILRLEQNGIYFAKDLSKSIIYSVAPPGTSQHLSMLALDVKEFENARVRQILAQHGWHQTVVSDLPHFTFLGVSEKELQALGLKEVVNEGRVFWVPDI
ncbi:MAG: hypothetical protein ABIO36_08445 [Pyrinomonadaceae bacterium]